MAAGKKKDRSGNRTRIVKVRLTEDEFALMRTVMEAGGYPTVSCFLREVITRKRLPPRNANKLDYLVVTISVQAVLMASRFW